MKIEGNSLNPVQPGKGGGASGVGGSGASEATRRAARLGYGQESPPAAGETSPEPPPDQISLSELSRQVNRLATADAGREARVEQLTADYEAGRLKLDTAEAARKLVDDAFLNDDE